VSVHWAIAFDQTSSGHHRRLSARRSISSSSARALEPLVRTFPHSGEIAQGLLALGIVSLGMLAIPVMAGSTPYALSEARGTQEGLDLNLKQGRYFYGVIAASMLIGLGLNFIGVNPIKALVFAAVFNRVAAVLRLAVAQHAHADVHRHGRFGRGHGRLVYSGLRDADDSWPPQATHAAGPCARAGPQSAPPGQ
jgi:hypothetical protein